MASFAISGQHYLFDVQSFASVVLSVGGDAYQYALRDRTTKDVIADVASGRSELGVLVETTTTKDALESAFAESGVVFRELIKSSPRVALPASHPLVNARSLTLDELDDYPYIYFEQEDDAPIFFAEEALAQVSRPKSIACTDRASLSELIVALNGYTVTSGILVGISDGKGLATVPLECDVKLHLGYITKAGAELSDNALKFVAKLESNLNRYARF